MPKGDNLDVWFTCEICKCKVSQTKNKLRGQKRQAEEMLRLADSKQSYTTSMCSLSLQHICLKLKADKQVP